MSRYPDGITGQNFYFKDITGKAPELIDMFLYHSAADDCDRNYLVAKDEASLYLRTIKEFARVVARLVQEQIPKFTTIERVVKERGGKCILMFYKIVHRQLFPHLIL